MANEELGGFGELAALEAAALVLDFAELVDSFLELAGETRAPPTTPARTGRLVRWARSLDTPSGATHLRMCFANSGPILPRTCCIAIHKLRGIGNCSAASLRMPHTCHYLCSEIVTVTYEHQPGEIRQTAANLEEISRDKAVLLVEEPPHLGTPISLAIQGRDLFGVVRDRLHDAALGWFAFISLDAASRWSQEWFAPKHLLAMCGCTPEPLTNAKGRYLDSTRNAEENVPVDFVGSEA